MLQHLDHLALKSKAGVDLVLVVADHAPEVVALGERLASVDPALAAIEDLAPKEVVMEVTGSLTDGADLTIAVGDLNSQQANSAVPVTTKGGKRGLHYTARSGDFLYISAQRDEDNSGSIRCSIKVDGVIVAENESRGPYTIATCSGRTP